MREICAGMYEEVAVVGGIDLLLKSTAKKGVVVDFVHLCYCWREGVECFLG